MHPHRCARIVHVKRTGGKTTRPKSPLYANADPDSYGEFMTVGSKKRRKKWRPRRRGGGLMFINIISDHNTILNISG